MATGKQPGKHVNRTGLAETLGVVLPTVDGWVRKGCPFVERGGRGKEWVFDTADVARWLRDEAVAAASPGNGDGEDIDMRQKRARMRLAELELAKALELVAPIESFKRAMASVCAEVRANCLNIPQRVVTQLLGETDETVFKQVLKREIVLALEATRTAVLVMDADTADADPTDESDA